MKKLFYLTVAALMLATPEAWSTTGTEESPLTVTELLAQGTPDEAVPETYVQGYIVGSYAKVFGVYQPEFGIPSSSVTYMLLGETADVRQLDKCVVVHMPKGEIRDAISPYKLGNLGRKVAVRGSHEAVQGLNGIKNTDWYKFIEDKDPDEPVIPDDPDMITIFDSLNEDAWTMDPYWTEDIVTMPSSMSYVWRWKSVNGKNFMNASGYVNENNNTTKSYLIAKSTFNLIGYKSVGLSFEHAAKFQTTLRDLCGFYVQEVGDTQWTEIEIPQWPAAGTWNFANSGNIDLSAYIGKNIRIAFLYASDETGADTWEVRNLRMTGKVDGTELKPAGLSWSAASATAVIDEEFEAPVLTFNTTAPISYTSSDPQIAAVYSDGHITAFKEGTVEITATSPRNGEYEEGSASFTLTVVAPEKQPKVFGILLDWNAAECDWTFENEYLAEGLEYVWRWEKYNDAYYLKGNAFKNNTPYEARAYAISPVVSLEGYEEITVSFEHAAKFQTNLASLSSFLIREEGDTEWTRLHIANWPEPGSWAFTNSGKADISAFDGKRVQIAFLYGSNEYKADTWEVRNVRLSGVKKDSTGISGTEAAATGETPRYYDLSGRPVSGTPAAGLYIRVAGGKADRIVVR